MVIMSVVEISATILIQTRKHIKQTRANISLNSFDQLRSIIRLVTDVQSRTNESRVPPNANTAEDKRGEYGQHFATTNVNRTRTID